MHCRGEATVTHAHGGGDHGDRLLLFADMSATTRARVLGCPVDVVAMDEAVRRLAEIAGAPPGTPPVLVVTANPEIIMRARREAAFKDIIESAALVVPDGIGLVRALQRRGHRNAVRVAGADLLEAYLPAAAQRGQRLALVGAGPGVAEEAARRLRNRHPGLDVMADGGDPLPSTARRLAAAAPAVVAAAYGAGAQERFLRDHLAAIGARAGIGVGGTLDYIAGASRRAPASVQGAGLEWLWRLVVSPRRWRRQLVLPIFWWLERREARR